MELHTNMENISVSKLKNILMADVIIIGSEKRSFLNDYFEEQLLREIEGSFDPSQIERTDFDSITSVEDEKKDVAAFVWDHKITKSAFLYDLKQMKFNEKAILFFCSGTYNSHLLEAINELTPGVIVKKFTFEEYTNYIDKMTQIQNEKKAITEATKLTNTLENESFNIPAKKRRI
ncbi:hypothetical protein [Leclercia adecarboxylata]|uniref:hypothetical protein n=1 Tax=Leclercia adecarboxylata TaxID=83655 RepID=UPI00301B43E8